MPPLLSLPILGIVTNGYEFLIPIDNLAYCWCGTLTICFKPIASPDRGCTSWMQAIPESYDYKYTTDSNDDGCTHTSESHDHGCIAIPKSEGRRLMATSKSHDQRCTAAPESHGQLWCQNARASDVNMSILVILTQMPQCFFPTEGRKSVQKENKTDSCTKEKCSPKQGGMKWETGRMSGQ